MPSKLDSSYATLVNWSQTNPKYLVAIFHSTSSMTVQDVNSVADASLTVDFEWLKTQDFAQHCAKLFGGITCKTIKHVQNAFN